MHRLLLTIIGFIVLFPAALRAEPLRIAVASNFAPTLAILADQFEQASGQSVVLIAGSTGKHYAQITHGAPFDAFFAADRARPELLERNGLGIAGSRFSYAHGRLVLMGRTVDTGASAINILQQEQFRHLAMANPELAPYGLAARDTLIHIGLWPCVRNKLVLGENIAQAYQFVHSGNAEFGLLSLAQARASDPSAGNWIEIPRQWHSAIDQQAVLLHESAREFMAYVRSTPARATILAQGYELP